MSGENPELKPLEVAMLGFGYAWSIEHPEEPWFSYGDFNDAVIQSLLRSQKLKKDVLSRTAKPLTTAGYLIKDQVSVYPSVLFRSNRTAQSALYKNVTNYVLQKNTSLPRLLLAPQTIETLKADGSFGPYLVKASFDKTPAPSQHVLPDLVVLGFAHSRARWKDPWFRTLDIDFAPRDTEQLPLHSVSVRRSVQRLATSGLLVTDEIPRRYSDNYQSIYSASPTTQEGLYDGLSQQILTGARNLSQLLVLPRTVEYIMNDVAFEHHLLECISNPPPTSNSQNNAPTQIPEK